MNRYLGIVLLTVAGLLGTFAPGWGQTAALLPNGIQYFMDNNGKPLSNGKVYFYTPSTTTPKTTWTDAAETTPQANPVVLGISGRPTNPIYGDGSYRQVVKDQFNNTIWDFNTASTGSGGGSSPTATGDGDLVGTIKPWAGMTAPNQYAFTYGQEVSRTTYATLFTAITSTQNVFCTSGSPILTGLADTTNFWIGMTVEIGCLAAGNSTVVAKTSSSVTLASNANVSTSVSATFFPWGRGNGSTTFNLPDFRGVPIAGNNNMGGVASSNLTTTYFGATDPNSSGALGGSQSKVLLTANLPSYTPSGTIGVTNTTTTAGAVAGFPTVTSGAPTTTGWASGTGTNLLSGGVTAAFTGTAQGGTSTAFSIVQPTRTSNYIIKITPDSNSATASGVTSLGSMTGDIACGANLTCTGNIISGAAQPWVISGSDIYYNTGKVGIGTGMPSNDLTVLQSSDSQTNGGFKTYRNNGTSSVSLFQGSDDNSYLLNNGTGGVFLWSDVATIYAKAGGGIQFPAYTTPGCLENNASGHIIVNLSACGTNVVSYGATNDCSTDSTAAINAAIAAARHASPSFGLAYTGSRVFFPPGIYCVSSINATQTAAITLEAAPSSVIIYGNQQVGTPRAIIDMTGSSGSTLNGIIVSGQNPSGTAPAVIPAAGFLLAQSSAAADCNKNRLSNSGTLGQFTNAAVYMYGCTDNIFDGSGFQQGKLDAPVLFHSSTNDFGIASAYTTIATGTMVTGENSFYSVEFHSAKSALSTSPAVSLKDAYAVRFYGGNNDANGATTSHFYFQGTNNAITVNGVQVYSEAGTLPAYVFESNGATINGLVVTGVHALFNAFSTSEFSGAGFVNPIVTSSPGLTNINGPAIPNSYVMGNVSGASAQAVPISAAQMTTLVTALPLTQIATIPNTYMLGNVTGSTNPAAAISPAQVTANLDAFTSVLKGVVPASGGGTTNFLRADGTWAGAPSSRSHLSVGCDTSALSAGVTLYLGTNSCGTSAAFSRIMISAAGTIGNLYVQGGGSPGAGQTFIWTVRKNGSAQTLTCTVADAAVTCNNAVNTFSVVAGDYIDITAVGSAGASSSGQNWASVTFAPS